MLLLEKIILYKTYLQVQFDWHVHFKSWILIIEHLGNNLIVIISERNNRQQYRQHSTDIVINRNYPGYFSSTMVLFHLSSFDLGNAKLLSPWRHMTSYLESIQKEFACDQFELSASSHLKSKEMFPLWQAILWVERLVITQQQARSPSYT